MIRDSPYLKMEYSNFEELVEDIKNIDSEQNYWMVRTMGGTYFDEFFSGNYIAVGYNAVTLADINLLPHSDSTAKDVLKAMFQDRYPNLRNTGYPVAQLLRFSRDIKSGDIVIIPSSGASNVAFGTVIGDMYEEEHPLIDIDHHCDFKKRYRIEWKYKTVRYSLPPSLQLMFNSRHILSDVNSYAPYIDSIMNDCYVKDDILHLVLKIQTQNEVSLDDFCDIKAISTLIEDFCRKNEIPHEDALIMKIQMESPGWLRLSTKNIFKLLAFGLFITALTGGGLKYTTDNGLELYTNGIPGAINDYLDRAADRNLINSAARAMDSLKIKSPDDMKPIIEILKAKNEGRRNY